MYLNPNKTGDSYGNLQSNPADGLLYFPDEFMSEFFKDGKRAAGFVTIEHDEKKVTSCVWDDEAYQRWAEDNPEQPEPETSNYIPTAEQSAVVMMRAAFAQQVETMDDDVIIQCSGLADTWTPGNHKVGEVYNAGDQTWECYQAYDNSVYQDVKPSDPSWYTFNRPLHGKSPATARPFVPVQGTHDMYRAGEYMVYTDGKTYRCKSDTNFSPSDYAQAWEVVVNGM